MSVPPKPGFLPLCHTLPHPDGQDQFPIFAVNRPCLLFDCIWILQACRKFTCASGVPTLLRGHNGHLYVQLSLRDKFPGWAEQRIEKPALPGPLKTSLSMAVSRKIPMQCNETRKKRGMEAEYPSNFQRDNGWALWH